MTVGEEIRERVRAQPFQPFVIYTSDGKELPVKHPDYCLITPGDHVIYVFQTESKRDVVAVHNITRIEHNVCEAAHGKE